MGGPHDEDVMDASRNGASSGDEYIICIDDDVEFVRSLELFLPERINGQNGSSRGYEFGFVADPNEALATIESVVSDGHRVAMVICDQQMPDMNGTSLLAEVKKRHPDCARILLTGHAGLDAAVTAINEDLLDRYLTKPISDEHAFASTVLLVLEGKGLRRRISRQESTIRELYSFSTDLAAAHTLEGAVETVIDFTERGLACDHVEVLVRSGAELTHYRRTDGVLRASCVAGAAPTPFEIGLEKTRVCWIQEPEAAERFRANFAAVGGDMPPPAVLAAPLLFASQLIGGIVAGKHGGGLAPNDADREIMSYIAHAASVAIQNAVRRKHLETTQAALIERSSALAAANTRLQQLDRVKSDFLTFVSHELRTPLTGLGAIELLKPDASAPDQVELIKAIRASHGRLWGFVERGTRYFELLATEPGVIEARLDFAELVRRTVKQNRRLAAANIPLILGGCDEPLPVLGRERDLIELIEILLDNVVKHAEERTECRVEVIRDGAVARLVVSDKGVGFQPSMAEEIFRPFTVADISHHSRGYALSLACAAAIAKAHGGQILARSDGPGLGATFTLEVPLSPGDTGGPPRIAVGGKGAA